MQERQVNRLWRPTTYVRNIKIVLKRTAACPWKLRAKDRTLHCTRHRFATAFFARRFDARVQPLTAASVDRLLKQNAGGDI
ncbi:hypothetical protein EVAR_9863_1 [Eumeta japonica]|uniref:Uncharacterized protein n=1 Tax=Eumeta variegata TaxID=151549 RepID=A0A4C1TQ90_EUMVA|nr:hypothetical protein EVAR_9863_1 [Eumeta japonica]